MAEEDISDVVDTVNEELNELSELSERLRQGTVAPQKAAEELDAAVKRIREEMDVLAS